MPIQETSRKAWESVQKTLGHKQSYIMEVLTAFGPLTNAEMSEHIGWQINSITPRTNELTKMGLVEAKGLKIGKSGKKAIAWGIV